MDSRKLELESDSSPNDLSSRAGEQYIQLPLSCQLKKEDPRGNAGYTTAARLHGDHSGLPWLSKSELGSMLSISNSECGGTRFGLNSVAASLNLGAS